MNLKVQVGLFFFVCVPALLYCISVEIYRYLNIGFPLFLTMKLTHLPRS